MADGGENYYDTLGVHKDSTEKEILKAYRKKALKCHPDKNPDNPKASELFHKLSKALEVLTDPKARAAFNNLLNAKERNKLRNQKLDAKRKKFKQDLEESEKSAKQEKESDEEIARRLQAEIERLREEGSRLLQEQQELLKAQIREEEQKTDDLDQQHLTPKLKIKWKSKKSDECNGGYNKELLLALFQKYGGVTHLLISSTRKGSAIVEYEHVTKDGFDERKRKCRQPFDYKLAREASICHDPYPNNSRQDRIPSLKTIRIDCSIRQRL
ncbi:dnaJ homolog subfamily C member 17 isoform X2 [Nematostella vectensis]|uniref:dnaJ homolog subfamily C member 17 isoform X2 n=1 Tax=Nematostella vectensis TaxID=45351 RepID=UPI0020771B25|nr:dnaJ homolog subfamily C member 17 isoform X2 [Nematostella vectensis]